ncbi:hypothetical protein AB0H63_23645 [Micromonospora echinospora]|uniref:hypothetical protein n=1 Tax=Micromonospora echinospora TaxID=1877 RepID=UPI0033F7DD28
MVETPGMRWGRKAARRLARLGSVRIGPGLTGEELARVEERFGFEFADDHRSFLAAGLPAGGGWPDWRYGNPDGLRQWLALPGKGVLEAVRFKGYWASSWGARPDGLTDAEEAAAEHLAAVPWLVPVFGRRYLPAGRRTYGHPVLSVYGADIICWAPDLVDYVLQEFGEGGVGKRYSYEGWEMSASAEFWAEYLEWSALEP